MVVYITNDFSYPAQILTQMYCMTFKNDLEEQPTLSWNLFNLYPPENIPKLISRLMLIEE